MQTIQLAIILCDNNDLHVCRFMQKASCHIYTQSIYSIVIYGIITLLCKTYE